MDLEKGNKSEDFKRERERERERKRKRQRRDDIHRYIDEMKVLRK